MTALVTASTCKTGTRSPTQSSWRPPVALRPPVYVEAPYSFPNLADTSEAEEQAAIDAGLIRAGGIRYAATRN
jgi:hypothetical protein